MIATRRALPGLALAALLTAGFAPSAAPPPRVCHLPATVVPAPVLTPPANEIVQGVSTAYYMLAMTWAPEACRGKADDPDLAIQCRANRFGFVLHGLWPNGSDGRHPRYCGPAGRISPATVRKHLCMTPSPASLQHEWASHGTCGWSSPEAYFADADRLWRGLRLPPMPATLTAGEIRAAFVKANPGVRRDGIYIKTVDGGRLMDVRLCYDLRYQSDACKGGLGAPDGETVRITPRRPR